MTGNPSQLIVYLATVCDDNKEYEVKEYKHKRSLNANAYYWVLVNKMANALNQSKEFVHLSMLKQYGVTYSMLVPENFPISQYVKYYELDGVRQNNGKKFKCYKVYMGSSEMNTYEMSKLIDGTVYEAQSMGIETLSPDELERLKSMWGDGDEKRNSKK